MFEVRPGSGETAGRGTIDALRHRLAFEDLLARVAASLVVLPDGDVDAAVERALAEIGSFAEVDHVVVYVIDDERGLLERTHHHAAPDTSTPAGPAVMAQARLPRWLATLRSGEPVYIPRLDDLGGGWAAERDLMQRRGLSAALAVGLTDEGSLIGYIGFESSHARSWSDDHLALLQSAAGVITQALARADAEQRFEAAFSDAPMGMVLSGPDGRQLLVNRAFCELLGSPASELLGRSLLGLVHPEDRDLLLARTRELAAGLVDRIGVELRALPPEGPDGVQRWYRAQTSAVRRRDGAIRYLVAHVEDITERRAGEEELRASEERYRRLVENSPAIVMRYDRSGRVVYSSPAFAELVAGAAGGQVRGSMPWRAVFDEVVAAGRRVDTEWEVELGDGVHWFQSRAVPELDADGSIEHVLVMSTDITALKRTEAELAHQALHDPLTGLANRALLLDHLGGALGRARRHDTSLALLFLDLDRFKVVNDSLGHGVGDKLLEVVAERLLATVRETDVVARLGGDEFVVLADELDGLGAALDVAERIRSAVREPVHVEGDEVFTTASIGVALADDQVSAEGLLRDADVAMYRAKALGRDRIEVFDEYLREQAMSRLRTESLLRRAIEFGELEVHYQPEVDLRDGSVVGAEALARWRHPDRGLLAASAFIGLAEETGYILELGSWVLAEACRQVGAWRDEADFELTLRVNLSARQIAQPELPELVRSALEEASLPASSLCLEITETALMADAAAALRVLHELRDLGVELAVDDFGTGYSSLAYLKRFPVQVLKVDRNFVEELGTDDDGAAIVAAVVGLGRALGLRVVAEGVETPRQLEELKGLGVDAAQGFLFSGAVPSRAFRETAEGLMSEGRG